MPDEEGAADLNEKKLILNAILKKIIFFCQLKKKFLQKFFKIFYTSFIVVFLFNKFLSIFCRHLFVFYNDERQSNFR
jgi:hypothetical protein